MLPSNKKNDQSINESIDHFLDFDFSPFFPDFADFFFAAILLV